LKDHALPPTREPLEEKTPPFLFPQMLKWPYKQFIFVPEVPMDGTRQVYGVVVVPFTAPERLTKPSLKYGGTNGL
jgi:hypothetical protein